MDLIGHQILFVLFQKPVKIDNRDVVNAKILIGQSCIADVDLMSFTKLGQLSIIAFLETGIAVKDQNNPLLQSAVFLLFTDHGIERIKIKVFIVMVDGIVSAFRNIGIGVDQKIIAIEDDLVFFQFLFAV